MAVPVTIELTCRSRQVVFPQTLWMVVSVLVLMVPTERFSEQREGITTRDDYHRVDLPVEASCFPQNLWVVTVLVLMVPTPRFSERRGGNLPLAVITIELPRRSRQVVFHQNL